MPIPPNSQNVADAVMWRVRVRNTIEIKKLQLQFVAVEKLAALLRIPLEKISDWTSQGTCCQDQGHKLRRKKIKLTSAIQVPAFSEVVRSIQLLAISSYRDELRAETLGFSRRSSRTYHQGYRHHSEDKLYSRR